MVTILDIKKIEAGNGYNVIEENVKLHPEFTIVPADTIPGTDMTLTVRTDLPTVQFSRINEGVPESKGGYSTRIFQLAFLDALIKCDVRLLENRTADAAGRYLESEQSAHVEAAMRHAGKQFYYGLANDDKGFVGLIAQMNTDAAHVFDLNAPSGEGRTSVFLVAKGPEKVQWLFGNNRTLDFDDWMKQTVKGVNNLDMEAMISWMHFAAGVRLANRNALVRIKNIGTTVNAVPATNKALNWDIMQDAVQSMRDELGMEPTDIFMTGRSRRQLRDLSKTPEHPNPPLPKDFEGIPIHQTHSISNAETI